MRPELFPTEAVIVASALVLVTVVTDLLRICRAAAAASAAALAAVSELRQIERGRKSEGEREGSDGDLRCE